MTERHLKVLITVKTYPVPSSKYDELVCTAGVTADGEFIRLYPINFRDLPHGQRYAKYQWLELDAVRHDHDYRKESYRPVPGTLRLVGEPLTTKDNWAERAAVVLKDRARSMEELWARNERDETSLGIVRPVAIRDLRIEPDATEWKSGFLRALAQQRLWDDRKASKTPPRKVPFKFRYDFSCDDPSCNGHKMMIEDWEAGALYLKGVDAGLSPEKAAERVKAKFLGQLCTPGIDTHFFVGNTLAYRKSWMVIGVFWPKKRDAPRQAKLF